MDFEFKKGSGIGSVAIAGVSILLIFFFFLLIVPFVHASYPSSDVTPALIMGGMWLGIFVLLAIGIFAGFFGLFDKEMRGFAWLGLILNLIFLGVYVLGLKFLT